MDGILDSELFELQIIATGMHLSPEFGETAFEVEKDRFKIVSALNCVDEVFLSIDKDKTQCESLRHLKPTIFAKGGDRTSGEIPESKVCKELDIQIIDGLGAKIRSSSKLTGIKEIK